MREVLRKKKYHRAGMTTKEKHIERSKMMENMAPTEKSKYLEYGVQALYHGP